MTALLCLTCWPSIVGEIKVHDSSHNYVLHFCTFSMHWRKGQILGVKLKVVEEHFPLSIWQWLKKIFLIIYTTPMPERCSLALFRWMRMGWLHGHAIRDRGQFFKSDHFARWMHSPFGHAMRWRVFGSQRGAVISALQTLSSRMFVLKGESQIWVSI